MADDLMTRRLAAILAADVVGYSRLMERDEAGTLSALKDQRRQVLEPLVARHQGRIFKVAGDGVLVEFASAVHAVQCAIGLQRGMGAANAKLPNDRRIVLRIGINLGDIMVEGGDLYGDGVNIAARLETMAEPGGILISGTAFDHIRNKIEAQFEDLGPQVLKNITEPIRAYRLAFNPSADSALSKIAPGKPAIAVLPFTNMSGDAEQEYFSDGITEDIITDLSKVSSLNVLSRNTSFAFKGKSVSTRVVASQLGVGYVVEGSVRKAAGRVRITAQLIDAIQDSHVWAERYDRDLSDIFALQDEISRAIVAALKVKLLPEERRAIERRSTENPKAYELYLLARYYQLQYGVRAIEIALRFCQRALEVDPRYARAWALTSLCEVYQRSRGLREASGLSAAEAALSLDPTLAEAHAAKGQALYQLGRISEAQAAHEESMRLGPDSYDVRVSVGMTCMRMGGIEAAIEHFERAAQLLQSDYMCLSLASGCYHALGRHAECKSAAWRALLRIDSEIALRPDNMHAMALGASDLVYLGEKERALDWISRALIIDPDDSMNLYNLACALASLDECDQALDLLERHVQRMNPERIDWIRRDDALKSLYGRPRWQALIADGEARLAAYHAEQAAKPG